MSIRYADSFQAYAAIADAEKAGFSLTSTPTISSVGGRRGGRAIRFSGVAAQTAKMVIPGAAAATMAVCMAVRIADLSEAVAEPGRMLMFYDGSTPHVGISVLVDGSIRAYRMTSETVTAATLGTSAVAQITNDNYHHLEVEVTIHDSAGVVKVYLDGNPTPVLNLTAQDTRNGGTAQVTAVAIGLERYDNVNQTMCDFVVRDGTVQLGDVRVDYRAAASNGASNEFTTNGAATNYQNVDELNPSDVDYNYSNTADALELYGVQAIDWSPATIHALVEKVRAFKSDAGTRSMIQVGRSGGNLFEGAAQDPLTTSQYVHRVHDVDPDTAVAWNESGVNDYQLGLRVA